MQAENKFVTKTLGWKPTVSFEEGLGNSVKWYKNFVKIYFDKESFFKNLYGSSFMIFLLLFPKR